jgi:transposase
MSLRMQSLPSIAAATAAAVQAAFPKGNLYVELRAEFSTLYDDQLFADLYPPQGRPVEVAPWRLALVAVRITSPYDLEARDSSKRETHWVGYKVHLTETCDAGHPDLMTQVMTTPATIQDSVMGPALQQDLANRDVLPGIHLLNGGYVDADLLVTAQTQHQIDVVGPPFGSYSRRRREGEGYDLQAFVIDWEAQQAHCPQGHTSVNWRLGHDVSGDPAIRIRFDGVTCRACPVRRACTSAQAVPRQLTVRPQVHHEALQAARQRQETARVPIPVRLAGRGGE